MILVLFNKEKLIFVNREMGYKNGQTRGGQTGNGKQKRSDPGRSDR